MLRHVVSNMYLTVTNEISTISLKNKLSQLEKKKNLKSEYLLLKEYKKTNHGTTNIERVSNNDISEEEIRDKSEQSFL